MRVETEKYAHVTFFFNGGREEPFLLEERQLIASPRNVATYDLKPEMSSAKVARAVADAIASAKYPFVMCNLAPPDMVGHSGNYEATVEAVEATDVAIGVIAEACKDHGYTLVITADHGNAEQMLDAGGAGPHTAHTCNPVPLIVASWREKYEFKPCADAALCDIAPTILSLMGIPKPHQMTRNGLLPP